MKDTEKLNSATSFKTGDVAGGNYIEHIYNGNPKVFQSGVFQGSLKSPFPKTAQKVLFLFAHPDDEQYMAGSIQKMIANGHNIYVAYTTSGQNGTDVTGTYPSGSIALRDAREAEAIASLTNLGVNPVNIYALRGDSDSKNVPLITTELANRLATDGIEVDCIITFDDVGVYWNGDPDLAGAEHAVCQLIGLEYYRLTSFIDAIYYFTIPKSDIDTDAGTDLTDVEGASVAIKDSLVDWHYYLSTTENTNKKAVLDYHVTQYIDPTKSLIKSHYDSRPFEYFSFGYGKLKNQDDYNQGDYLKMLFRQ